MLRRLTIFVVLSVISVGTTLALHQDEMNKPKTSTPQKDTSKQKTSAHHDHMSSTDVKLSSADKEFIMKAAEGGMSEVEFGQLAVGKANSADVKQFAQRMIDDHSKANDELKQLAQNKGVTLPATINDKDMKEKDKLAKLSGADFDKTYMRAMVKDHEKDVAEFEHVSNSAKDADVKAWASATLPTLKDHLQMARDTASKIGLKMETPAAMSNKKP
jgi:putative membrane protein